MPSPLTTRTNRFQSFTPHRPTSTSLRRLRTAFSPSRSHRSTSPSSSTGTTSPLTRDCSPSSFRSASSSAASIRHMLSIRRKPSVLEFEMEEERHLFGTELDVLEPRPQVGFGSGFMGARGGEGHVVGIFEVLDGKC
ncbi:hypothetical protein FB567DRAFT_544058 [Paraphoma chrysanthemicola]|uniref:Uncharacterized protein n=1 Tax=Paraphoma chrysanthemicola TaxID=798071 RepID=A0A8K0W615_9PLEO|nr:hypothetical protein FB567DRAFT_544058 [Paraphoma chrysanthemicola]